MADGFCIYLMAFKVRKVNTSAFSKSCRRGGGGATAAVPTADAKDQDARAVCANQEETPIRGQI